MTLDEEGNEIISRLTFSTEERWAKSQIERMFKNTDLNPTVEAMLKIDRMWGPRDYAADLARNLKEAKNIWQEEKRKKNLSRRL